MYNTQATVDCLKNMSFESFVVGMDACRDSHYTGLWCPLNYSMLLYSLWQNKSSKLHLIFNLAVP